MQDWNEGDNLYYAERRASGGKSEQKVEVEPASDRLHSIVYKSGKSGE